MSMQCIQGREDVFNKINPKGKNLENEIHNKIIEENNKGKNGKDNINNVSKFQINESGNDKEYIMKLKRGLNPANFNQNELKAINGNFDFYKNYCLYNKMNLFNKNYINNNYINRNFLNNYYLDFILKSQFNKIIELESMFNKLKEIGLKALSSTNNKNNYLLN